jgi:rubrerythrin
MTISKESALRLASNAMDMGAVALRGALSVEGDGQFTVGGRSLSEWLDRYANQEVVVILAPVDTTPHDQIHQCGVCGRDYEGEECPHCAQVRYRLRGE